MSSNILAPPGPSTSCLAIQELAASGPSTSCLAIPELSAPVPEPLAPVTEPLPQPVLSAPSPVLAAPVTESLAQDLSATDQLDPSKPEQYGGKKTRSFRQKLKRTMRQSQYCKHA